jgi:hypothetical protein
VADGTTSELPTTRPECDPSTIGTFGKLAEAAVSVFVAHGLIGEIEREEREVHTYGGVQRLTPECME